jgi:hypothetical protein
MNDRTHWIVQDRAYTLLGNDDARAPTGNRYDSLPPPLCDGRARVSSQMKSPVAGSRTKRSLALPTNPPQLTSGMRIHGDCASRPLLARAARMSRNQRHWPRGWSSLPRWMRSHQLCPRIHCERRTHLRCSCIRGSSIQRFTVRRCKTRSSALTPGRIEPTPLQLPTFAAPFARKRGGSAPLGGIRGLW